MPPLGTDRIDGTLHYDSTAGAVDAARALQHVIAALREAGVEPQVIKNCSDRARVMLRLSKHARATVTVVAPRAPDMLHIQARFVHRVISFRRRVGIVMSGVLMVAGAVAGLAPVAAIWCGWLPPADRTWVWLLILLYFVALPLSIAGSMIGNGCGRHVRAWIANLRDWYVVGNADYHAALQRWELLAAARTRLMMPEPAAGATQLFAPEMVAQREFRRTEPAPDNAREHTRTTLAAYAQRACDTLTGSGVAATYDVTRNELKLHVSCATVQAHCIVEWTRAPALPRGGAPGTPYEHLSVMVSAVVRPLVRANTIRTVLAWTGASVTCVAAVLLQLNFFLFTGWRSTIMLLYSFGCAAAGYWLGARIGDLAEWYIARRLARNTTYQLCVRTLDEFVNNVDRLLHDKPFTILF